MTVNFDWIMWLLAAICFGLGAFGVVVPRVNWMLLGFMFIAIAQLN